MSTDSGASEAEEPQPNEVKNPVDFDSVLDEIGSFGRYQKILYYSVCTPIILTTAIGLAVVFSAAVPKSRCFVPSCDNLTDPIYSAAISDGFANFTLPKDSRGQFDSCSHFSFRNWTNITDQCSAEDFEEYHVQNCSQGT